MYLTKKQYEHDLHKIKAKNLSYRRKQSLKDAKEYPSFKLPSTSKIVLGTVFVLCIQIILFCEHMVETTGDTNALYTLIGVPVTLVPTVIAYYQKSAKENTAGGIVYDTALRDQEVSG